MNDISPIGRSNPTGLNPTQRSGKTDAAQGASTPRGNDSVQLSTVAQMLSKLNQLPDIRQSLVNDVKSQIQTGTYETPTKVNAAVTALMQDLAGQYHN